MVLPNLQRIESGLHAFGDAENFYENGADESENYHRPTNFYTAGDLWNKVQSLIQQLLDYFMDLSNLRSLPLNPIGKSGNSGLSINSLVYNVSVNLGHFSFYDDPFMIF
ncbi:hypothetical protein RDWZM_004133 [Blomia tropicalis]|uniref:Uncharacterized protein n=1 Tax=Blomia tropicalis TaxID=40697 RepID=A0A9Q0MGI5_BLOTA|nr:hypothetical protein RDWZM_004133 [Blomia tropicalis]